MMCGQMSWWQLAWIQSQISRNFQRKMETKSIWVNAHGEVMQLVQHIGHYVTALCLCPPGAFGNMLKWKSADSRASRTWCLFRRKPHSSLLKTTVLALKGMRERIANSMPQRYCYSRFPACTFFWKMPNSKLLAKGNVVPKMWWWETRM